MKLQFFSTAGRDRLFLGITFGLSLLYLYYKTLNQQKIQSFDLPLYLSKIALQAEDVASYNKLDLLYAVVNNHATHIPYQNIDLYLNKKLSLGPLPLDPEALTNKLLHQKKGGMCYESSELLFNALLALNFTVKRIPCFPLNGQEHDPSVPSTHNILYVELEGSPYLIDTSYGYNGLRYPFPLSLDKTGEYEFFLYQNEKYRLNTYNDHYRLDMWIPDKNEWFSLYRFDKPLKFISHDETVLNNITMMTFNGLIPIRDTKLKIGKITPSGRVGYHLDTPPGNSNMFKLDITSHNTKKRNFGGKTGLQEVSKEIKETLGLSIPKLTN